MYIDPTKPTELLKSLFSPVGVNLATGTLQIATNPIVMDQQTWNDGWRQARLPLAEAFNRDGTWLDVGCANGAVVGGAAGATLGSARLHVCSLQKRPRAFGSPCSASHFGRLSGVQITGGLRRQPSTASSSRGRSGPKDGLTDRGRTGERLPLHYEHMFVYCGPWPRMLLPRRRYYLVPDRPLGSLCRALVQPAPSSSPGPSCSSCPGFVAGRAVAAGSSGAGGAVPRRWAPERWHSPARAGDGPSDRAGAGVGHAARLDLGGVPSYFSRSKPGAGIDELVALVARRDIIPGALVRGGWPSSARVCSSGRTGGRSRPSRPRSSPRLGRSMAERCCDLARDRRSRLFGSGHSRAIRRCQETRCPCTRTLFDLARARCSGSCWRRAWRR